MDLVVRAQRIPGPGETVLGGGYRTFPGGKGANQAVAAARAGSSVTLIGSVGDDAHGTRVRDALTAEGVDQAHLKVATGEATGLALITVAEGGENAIVVAPGANGLLTPADIALAQQAIEQCDVLVVQMEVAMPCVVAAAKAARAAGKCVVLNAAPARALPAELPALVDCLVVNQQEAMRLINVEAKVDPARLALRLLDTGVGAVIVTLGGQGALLAHKGRLRRVPTPTVKAIDSVGAGDAVCGVLASCMGVVFKSGKSREPREVELIEQAALLACAAGALATTKLGALGSMPKAADILKAIAGLKVT
jgi:ribokinase